MRNENTISVGINELLNNIKIMIAGISDLSVRKTFNNNISEAMNFQGAEKKKKIKNIYSNINKYISDSDSDVKNKKINIYDEPPTFVEAGLDFVHELCNDLLNMPKLSEYYSDMERDGFPSTNDWNKKSDKKTVKGSKKTRTIETFVKKDMIIVKGDTQSGKEKFTVASSIKTLLEGRIAIDVTRRITCDADKLERGITNYSKMFDEYMIKHKVKQEFKISCMRVSNCTLSELKKITPQIIVSLGNKRQLSNVLEFAERFPFKFDLYIDEIDNVDYGEDSDASEILLKLKKLSYQTIGITATPLDSILSEEELKSVNILRLSRPEDYRGFIDITVKLLIEDPKTNAVNRKITNYQDILDSDKNIELFLKYFSKINPEFAWSIKKYIPLICLIKNSRINESQETMFNGIIKNFSKEFVVILYNGNGIKMKYDNMSDKIIYKNKKIEPYKYIDLDITDTLQFLKDNGGVKSFPRIIIISGELAGRCTSFVSRDYEWHLTDMYYNPAKSTPIPEMIQSCGRLCGRNRGKSHLHLHCTKLVADALYNGFHFTNEIIERAIASPLMEEGAELSFSNSLKAIPMNKDKFPKKRNMTSKVCVKRKDFKLVRGDDKGIALNKYKYSEDDEKKEKKDYNEEEIEQSRKEVGNEEYKRLIVMFSRWSKDTSKIARFMQNLNPVKIYNEKEMKELCKKFEIPRIQHLLNIKVNNTNGFGTIIKKFNDTYRLFPCLISEFNKNFN